MFSLVLTVKPPTAPVLLSCISHCMSEPELGSVPEPARVEGEVKVLSLKVGEKNQVSMKYCFW